MIMKFEFVESIPEDVPEGVLFISTKFETVIHKCCCGCKTEVVTPLAPAEWRLTYDGETVSLYPSIGNWSFNCQSHYWIKKSKIIWAERFSSLEIKQVRESDSKKIKQYQKRKIKKKSFWEFLKFKF